MPSESRTLSAILLKSAGPTLSNVIFSDTLFTLSLFLLQLPLPQSFIGSLQVIITGFSVLLSRLSNSALPPESPFSTAPSSDPMVLWILSSDTCEKPPLRWSTSSSSITVFPAIPDSLEKFSRETYCEPLVAEDLIAAAFLCSEAFNSTIDQPFSFAIACARVVLPTPGGPDRSKPLFFGAFPESHPSSHIRTLLILSPLPSISDKVEGRYLSAQSSSLLTGFTR